MSRWCLEKVVWNVLVTLLKSIRGVGSHTKGVVISVYIGTAIRMHFICVTA